jgi:glycosyltransferase involved in cell wall biosynthesis
MRILTLCYEFPPLGGGGARVVHGLGKELVARGHEVDLVTMAYRDVPRGETVDGIRVHRVRCLRRHVHSCSVVEAATYFGPAGRLAQRLAASRKYDVAHAHFIFPDGLLASRLLRRSGLPFVVTAHGSDVPGYNPHRLKLLHRALLPLWRGVVAKAGAIACPSPFLGDLVRAHAPDAPVTVIPNGYDTERLRPDAPKRDRVLIVTRMVERKGVQHVLAAMARLGGAYDLEIVGDGPYLPELRRLAASLGSTARFHGWVDNSDPRLKALFCSSRIFVLFSEAENFPIVLLEAMAAGCAVVTTSGTGCAQVVGDAGVLVAPNDVGGLHAALAALTADRDRCEALGAAGRRRLEENFGWDVIVDRYVALYERAAAARRDRAAVRT